MGLALQIALGIILVPVILGIGYVVLVSFFSISSNFLSSYKKFFEKKENEWVTWLLAILIISLFSYLFGKPSY